MNFFDGWLALNARFDEGDLTAQTQLVGYKLFAVANDRKFPESFLLTDRELQSLTNIKSGRSIVEARRQLKNAGLIDFTTAKNKPTRYRLTLVSSKHEVSTKEAPSKHQVSTKEASGLVSYTHTREDVKTEDVKTKSVGYASAGANVEEINELIEYWSEELGGGRLTFEHQSKLVVFLERYGVEWVKAAMNEAADVNHDRHGVKPKLLFAILENKAKPKQQLRLLKGGERNGRKFVVEADPRSEFVFDD